MKYFVLIALLGLCQVQESQAVQLRSIISEDPAPVKETEEAAPKEEAKAPKEEEKKDEKKKEVNEQIPEATGPTPEEKND